MQAAKEIRRVQEIVGFPTEVGGYWTRKRSYYAWRMLRVYRLSTAGGGKDSGQLIAYMDGSSSMISAETWAREYDTWRIYGPIPQPELDPNGNPIP